MFKILLIEKNIIQSKKLIDCINNININFKIYGIAYNINELLNKLLIENFDLILLDANIDSPEYSIFFHFINEKNLRRYKKSIILLVNKNTKDLKDNFYIYNCISKSDIKEFLPKTILEFINKNNEQIVIQSIKNELKKLNFKYSYIGTKYLIDCIYQLSLSENKYDTHLFNDILPIVAKKYNKSADCIYGSIKSVIRNMYFDCEEQTLKEYFHWYEIEKPKPKELIFKILENIQ